MTSKVRGFKTPPPYLSNQVNNINNLNTMNMNKTTSINKGINGYEYVSDVKKLTYGEYTPQDFLFVVDKNDRLNLASIVEVAPNKGNTYDDLKSRWDNEKYKIEFGTIWHWEDEGEIEYHWS